VNADPIHPESSFNGGGGGPDFLCGQDPGCQGWGWGCAKGASIARLTKPADTIVFMEGVAGAGPMFAECCSEADYPGDRVTILAKMAAAYPAEGGFPAGYHPNRPLKRAKTDPNFWVIEGGQVNDDGTVMPVQRSNDRALHPHNNGMNLVFADGHVKFQKDTFMRQHTASSE